MIEAVPNIISVSPVAPKKPVTDIVPQEAPRLSFQEMLSKGIESTNTKIAEADKMVIAFTLDNDVPAHKVTFALEEARLSLEMMIQVRNRLVEGYQQIMNMQV
jgi:flagellar hook-basal body complex protein FliE